MAAHGKAKKRGYNLIEIISPAIVSCVIRCGQDEAIFKLNGENKRQLFATTLGH